MSFDFILLAAGNGRRLWPITESYPKPLARVLGRPLLDWILESINAHARKIIIVTGSKREKLEEYVALTRYANKVYFTVQEKQMGTGDAVRVGAQHVDERAVVLNGDSFASPAFFTRIINKAKKGDSFIVGKRVADGSNYGVLTEEKCLFKGIVEKPKNAFNCLASTGAFCAPKEFFSLLENLPLSPRGEYEVTDAFNLFSQKHDFHVTSFGDHEGDYWDDVGGYWNLLDANLYAAKHFAPKQRIDPSATIGKNVEIGENTFIGKNVVIKGHTKIRAGAVIEENCTVEDAEITASLLMRGAQARKQCSISSSVLCENAIAGEGAVFEAQPTNKGEELVVQINGKQIQTHKTRLGSVVGAGAHIKPHAKLAAGTLVPS